MLETVMIILAVICQGKLTVESFLESPQILNGEFLYHSLIILNKT